MFLYYWKFTPLAIPEPQHRGLLSELKEVATTTVAERYGVWGMGYGVWGMGDGRQNHQKKTKQVINRGYSNASEVKPSDRDSNAKKDGGYSSWQPY